jgi:multidrug resistance efflux pump
MAFQRDSDTVMGHAARLLLAGAALLIVAGAAWYGQHWWRTGRFIESTDDAYVSLGGRRRP